MRTLIFWGLLMLMGGCSGNPEADRAGDPDGGQEVIKPGPAEISFATDATPADAGLSAKYDRSCRTCHSLADAGAPLTGHKEAWQARFESKTMDSLLTSTKVGLNAMPPMGLCNDCTDEEFENLIAFMAKGTE